MYFFDWSSINRIHYVTLINTQKWVNHLFSSTIEPKKKNLHFDIKWLSRKPTHKKKKLQTGKKSGTFFCPDNWNFFCWCTHVEWFEWLNVNNMLNAIIVVGFILPRYFSDFFYFHFYAFYISYSHHPIVWFSVLFSFTFSCVFLHTIHCIKSYCITFGVIFVICSVRLILHMQWKKER